MERLPADLGRPRAIGPTRSVPSHRPPVTRRLSRRTDPGGSLMARTANVNPGPDDDPDDRHQTLRQGRRRANGEGTIGRRKDGRYEAKVFVSRSDGTYAR